jgi:hypothetical protein
MMFFVVEDVQKRLDRLVRVQERSKSVGIGLFRCGERLKRLWSARWEVKAVLERVLKGIVTILQGSGSVLEGVEPSTVVA